MGVLDKNHSAIRVQKSQLGALLKLGFLILYVHTYIHTYIHIYVSKYIYIYICTYIHGFLVIQLAAVDARPSHML